MLVIIRIGNFTHAIINDTARKTPVTTQITLVIKVPTIRDLTGDS
jgi:hypothetical protein